MEYGTWEQNQKLVMGTGFLLQLMLRLQLVRHIPHSREFIFFFSAPEEMSFVDADDVANDDYNDGEVILSQNETYVIERIFCKATRVRPEPTFIWTVGKKSFINLH